MKLPFILLLLVELKSVLAFFVLLVSMLKVW